jgi:hypothetical protein
VTLLATIGVSIQLVLLVGNWSIVVARESYATYQPLVSFLFSAEASPIVASARVISNGFVDTWLWKLATGWSGQPAAPGVAAVLTILWLGSAVLGGILLWQRVRRADEVASGV